MGWYSNVPVHAKEAHR